MARFCAVTTAAFAFLVILALSDAIDRRKNAPFASQVPLLFCVVLFGDLVYVFCLFAVELFGSHIAQGLAFTVGFCRFSQRTSILALSGLQLLRVLSSSPSSTASSLHDCVIVYERRQWICVILPIGFGIPALALIDKIAKQHVTVMTLLEYQAFPLFISGLLIGLLYSKAEKYAFHQGRDETAANKTCLAFLAVVFVESLIFGLVEVTTFDVMKLPNATLLTSAITASIHEVFRILLPAFYLACFRGGEKWRSRFLGRLENPTLTRVYFEGSLPDLTARRPTPMDTEMNSLMYNDEMLIENR